MKSLITVTDADEAEVVSDQRPEIVDIKNPSEGSLGASRPSRIEEICDEIAGDSEISIAIGDCPQLPGTIGLAVEGALRFDPDYIKIGLKEAETIEEGVEIIRTAVKTVDRNNTDTSVVVAGYGDYKASGTLEPKNIVEVGSRAGADTVMLDTLSKDKGNLLDILPRSELEGFTRYARQNGMDVALAGSLTTEDIKKVDNIGADIAGFRGAVCEQGRESSINSEKVENIVKNCKLREKQ